METKNIKISSFRGYIETQTLKHMLFADLSEGKVLDIGGSDAPNQYLDDNGKVENVILLDIRNPEKLPSKYNKVILFDLNVVIERKLPFPNNCLDTVILADVLEHIYHPVALLKEVHRILKSHGKLLLSVSSPRYYIELLHLLLTSKPMIFPEHKILYTREQIKNILKYSRFRILKVIGYSFWLPIIKLGFVNIKYTLPEILSWQQIYLAENCSVRGW